MANVVSFAFRSGARRSRQAQTLIGAVALAAAGLAAADDKDAFNVVVGVTATHEDNLFRSAALPANAQKSDNVYGANVGLRFDKEYSLQRIQLEATASKYRFDNNSFLDFSGVNYRGAWLWRVTPRISGMLSASRSETLVPYSDQRTVSIAKSTQINENRQFTFDGEVAAAWHVIGGLGQSRSRNAQPFQAVGDYVLTGGEIGGKYVSAAGNSVALVQRESNGEYEGRSLDPVGLFDTGFDQSETEARVLWQVGAHSSLDGRLGYLKREHDNFAQRNYRGTVGRLDYLWTPTGKLRFNFTAGRNLYSFQEAGHSYYVADTLAIAPSWLLSEKTTLRAKLEHIERDFRGAVFAASPAREDRTQSVQVGADWKVTRTGLIQGTLTHERRSSNIGGVGYSANVLGISGQLMF